MADLLTFRELALWTSATVGKDEFEVADDPFAQEVISKVSEMAGFVGGHPAWTLEPSEDQAPFDVRMVVLQVCKRSYENPSQVVQEGSIGPIGGDRVLDVAALFLDLTESERRTLSKYNLAGDPDSDQPTLFTISTSRGSETTMPPEILYVTDDSQINLAASADPRPWMIPLFAPGAPGGKG